MNVYQEAHIKIDQLPEETVYLFIQLMDRMSGDTGGAGKGKKLDRFFEAAGKIDIDGDAVERLRGESVI